MSTSTALGACDKEIFLFGEERSALSAEKGHVLICFCSEERAAQHFLLPRALTFFLPPSPWCSLNPGESDASVYLLSWATVPQQLDQV